MYNKLVMYCVNLSFRHLTRDDPKKGAGLKMFANIYNHTQMQVLGFSKPYLGVWSHRQVS